MLGTALQRVLAERGAAFVAPGEGAFDITDPVAVGHRLSDFAAGSRRDQRGVVLNAAAYTNVDGAEEHDELAYLVNSHGPALLARGARERGLGFVHVSTDFVFDGRKPGAYVETDDTNPLSVYGASKLAGELAVELEYPEALIVRTAWVFGPGGVNFPSKIVSAARSRPALGGDRRGRFAHLHAGPGRGHPRPGRRGRDRAVPSRRLGIVLALRTRVRGALSRGAGRR